MRGQEKEEKRKNFCLFLSLPFLFLSRHLREVGGRTARSPLWALWVIRWVTWTTVAI